MISKNKIIRFFIRFDEASYIKLYILNIIPFELLSYDFIYKYDNKLMKGDLIVFPNSIDELKLYKVTKVFNDETITLSSIDDNSDNFRLNNRANMKYSIFRKKGRRRLDK